MERIIVAENVNFAKVTVLTVNTFAQSVTFSQVNAFHE